MTSRLLSCGCVAGVYETYDGDVVALLDHRPSTCQDPNHQDGNEIPKLPGASTPIGAAAKSTRPE